MKYLIKTIEYGLYLLAFSLPLQTRWIIKPGFTEYQTYSLYGTDILLILLFILFIIGQLTKVLDSRFRGNDKRRNYFIFGLVLISFFSIFFAFDKALAAYKFGWLVLGVGLFWLIIKADYDKIKFIWALLLGMAIQACLAIWQFLNQATFANKWLGLALHRAGELGTSVIETVGLDGVGERWLRAYGGFDHPNILGGAMAIGILIIINYELRLTDYLKYFLIMIFSAALFFSFSRAAWLALLVGIAAMLLAAVIKKNLQAQKNILQAVLISGLVFFILFFLFPNLVMTRLYSANRLEARSTNERIESIKNSWPIIKNYWASGTGIGNYEAALEKRLPKKPSYFYQPAHNVFILIWSEIGIFGLLFFVCMLFKDVRRPSDVGRLSPIIILLCFDHWLWSLHFGVLFFWMVMAIFLSTADNEKMKN